MKQINKLAIIAALMIGFSLLGNVAIDHTWQEDGVGHQWNIYGKIFWTISLAFLVYIALSYYYGKHIKDVKFELRKENNKAILWGLIKSNMKLNIIAERLTIEYLDENSKVIDSECFIKKIKFEFKKWKHFGQYMEKRLHKFSLDDLMSHDQIAITLEYQSDWEKESLFGVLDIPSHLD